MSHAVDRYVGVRLRTLREIRGLSQSQLAEHLGVSFQQVQKYESGANRISASRLYCVCRVFSVEPNYFFQGLETTGGGDCSPARDVRATRAAGLIERIPETAVKEQLYGLIRSLATEDAPTDKSCHPSAKFAAES